MFSVLPHTCCTFFNRSDRSASRARYGKYRRLPSSGTISQHTRVTLSNKSFLCSYLAVSRPLEQRTREGQFSVKWICLGIAALAVLLNLPMIPFERSLVPCYFVTEDSIEQSVMNMPTQIGNNPIFALRKLYLFRAYRAL